MGQWRDLVKGIGEAVGQYVQAARDVVENTVYSDLAMDYAARGATELSNAIFTGNPYGPGSSMAPHIEVHQAGQELNQAQVSHDPAPEIYSPVDPMRGHSDDNERGISR